jgi:hypothetical protein
MEDKPGGKVLWQSYGAERLVWSEKMLAALEKGVKGNKWFSPTFADFQEFGFFCGVWRSAS